MQIVADQALKLFGTEFPSLRYPLHYIQCRATVPQITRLTMPTPILSQRGAFPQNTNVMGATIISKMISSPKATATNTHKIYAPPALIFT